MAKNWMAWEACEALLGNNKDEVAEIGSRYPLFARAVALANSKQVLELLKAIPKTTARVVETGLKDIDSVVAGEAEETDAVEEAPAKKETKKAKKEEPAEEVEDTEDTEDYESMTTKELYKLCCERGLSSKCKDRKKTTLIAVLKAGAGETEEADTEDEESWEDEEEKDIYAGKKAKELFNMCKERGIKAKPRQEASKYAELLKKDDAQKAQAEAEPEDDDDDDDWEI